MPDELNVLIVEDEQDSASVLSTILIYNGIAVTVVGDGQQCMNTIADLLPDVVMMDLNLPGLDGWSTLVEMRSLTATAHIPVIAITAYHSANVAQDAMKAGFDAYFAKPVNAQALVNQIHALTTTG